MAEQLSSEENKDNTMPMRRKNNLTERKGVVNEYQKRKDMDIWKDSEIKRQKAIATTLNKNLDELQQVQDKALVKRKTETHNKENKMKKDHADELREQITKWETTRGHTSANQEEMDRLTGEASLKDLEI